MAATGNETKDLTRQHDAIRAQMKFLSGSLTRQLAPSGCGTSSAKPDRMRLCLWSLYDFQEAILRHIDLDERIFTVLNNGTILQQIVLEHSEIKARVENVIHLAENAVYGKLSQIELDRCSQYINKGIEGICESLKLHMEKEDSALR